MTSPINPFDLNRIYYYSVLPTEQPPQSNKDIVDVSAPEASPSITFSEISNDGVDSTQYENEHAIMSKYEQDQIKFIGNWLDANLFIYGKEALDPLLTKLNLFSRKGFYQYEIANLKKWREKMRYCCQQLLSYAEQLLSPSNCPPLQRQGEYLFTVNGAKDLEINNSRINQLIQTILLEEFAKFPTLKRYFFKIEEMDFQGIRKVNFSQLMQTLKQCGLADQKGNLIPENLEKDESLALLLTKIQNKEKYEKILDILHCVAFRSNREKIYHNLTETKSLDPDLLSEMSRGKLSQKEAFFILKGLGFIDQGKFSPIYCPSTGEYINRENLSNQLKRKTLELVFDPKKIQENALFEEDIDWVKNGKNIEFLEEGISILVNQSIIPKTITKILVPIVPQEFHEGILFQLREASLNHETLRNLIYEPTQLEHTLVELVPEQELLITGFFTLLRNFIKTPLEKIESCALQLPNFNTVREKCLSLEQKVRLDQAIEEEKILTQKFKENTHIIRQFLLFSSEAFKVQKPIHFEIKWKMANVEVLEKMSIDKKCNISRTIQFPSYSDMTYSGLPDYSSRLDCSILENWEFLCQKFQLTDQQLAEKFLQFYFSGTIEENPEITSFLAHLIILFMGIEPSFEKGELSKNFILFQSVKSGSYSFLEALQNMGKISEGPVSAKQFLLHTSDRTREVLAPIESEKSPNTPSVQDNKIHSLRSYFVSTEDRIYHNVVTTAIRYFQNLYISSIDQEDVCFQFFKEDLENLLALDMPPWKIPQRLENELQTDKVKKLSLSLLETFNETNLLTEQEKPEQIAVNRCVEILRTDDSNHWKVTKVLEKFPKDSIENYILHKLAEKWTVNPSIEKVKEITNNYLVSMGEADDPETAIVRCQKYLTQSINPEDPKILKLQGILKKYFHRPVSFFEIGHVIEYEELDDLKDEIGSWAIDYLMSSHPVLQID